MVAFDFKCKFREIISDDSGKYRDNDAAQCLKNIIATLADDMQISLADAVLYFSERPDFGANGDAGGVNHDHQKGISFVGPAEDSTWMTLYNWVELIIQGGGCPGWWDLKWSTGRTDEEIEEELTAETEQGGA